MAPFEKFSFFEKSLEAPPSLLNAPQIICAAQCLSQILMRKRKQASLPVAALS
jgi:hypothetical protein